MARRREGSVVEDASAIGRYVRARRNEKNLTQVQVAETVGCAHSYISQLETKSRYVLNRRYLPRLADALGVPVEVLLELEGIRSAQRGEPRTDQQEVINDILKMTPEQIRMLRRVARAVIEGDEPTP